MRTKAIARSVYIVRKDKHWTVDTTDLFTATWIMRTGLVDSSHTDRTQAEIRAAICRTRGELL